MLQDNSIKFITSYPFIYQHENISLTECFLYSYFYSLNQAEKTIYCSNKYLAISLNKKIRTIEDAIKNLEKRGWITRIKSKGKRIICINYYHIDK